MEPWPRLQKLASCFCDLSSTLGCLQRSRDHPLSLILCAREYGRDQRLPWIQVWKAFLSCSHRWKNIVLCGEALQFRDLMIGCKGGFPLLQSFTLSPDEHFDCDAFPDAPRLTQFGLVYSDNGRIVSHAWLFSLSRLTTFTLAMDGIRATPCKFSWKTCTVSRNCVLKRLDIHTCLIYILSLQDVLSIYVSWRRPAPRSSK